MDYSTKLVYQSNYWYNDGLKRANIRDLSGAILSLRRSLQYNNANVAARNLLGLVYYGRGEVVEALVEWILSKNFQSKDNIANYFIKKVQEVPGELEQVNQAVKKYNQSIEYARQGGDDIAIIQLKKAVATHPGYVKARQLLALLYLKNEQYSMARQEIRAAHRLDTTDPVTLRYMHELNQIRKSRTVRIKDKKKEDFVSYNLGNETIIQPASGNFKENLGLHTVLNILIGLAVGVAVMWFLILPAVSNSRQKTVNKQTASFSDQIATQDAQISALKKELETYRSSDKKNKKSKATAATTQESYEAVMNIADHYKAGDMSNADMLAELLKVNKSTLGTQGKKQFEQITSSLYPTMCQRLFATATANYDAANYDTAISNLDQIMQMDQGYNDGKAMLLLAQCYEKQNKTDKANTYYQKIVDKYSGKEAATTAQEALNKQNKQN